MLVPCVWMSVQLIRGVPVAPISALTYARTSNRA